MKAVESRLAEQLSKHAEGRKALRSLLVAPTNESGEAESRKIVVTTRSGRKVVIKGRIGELKTVTG